MWDKVSLEEVGIPEPNSSNGCKLVLTTRSEQVCKHMGGKVIKVKPLSEEEALILFLNNVVPNMVQSRTLMPTLKLVVKECVGLPLTIVFVAGTLKGEDDPRIWVNALRELKERIGNVEAKVIEILKFSFYHLKDEKVKQCFLYCAVYPEDFDIEKDGLIECWIDEGFIEEMKTRQEMKDKGDAILKKLEDNCLLENAFDRPGVKMHDAVRDMALSITSKNPLYLIQAGLQLEKLPEEKKWTADIEKVSLMRNSISRIDIDMSPPKCPLLTTLLLQHNPIKNVPDSFFANMSCLGALNFSNAKIECLPNSISELKNLTALLLGGCEEFRHFPCLAKLQGLKKLDLHRTIIEEVPEGMDMLINLRYLDLRIETLKGIPVGLLPKLSRLQHLRFDEDNEKTRLKAEEVVPLEKLEFMSGSFEDMHEMNKFVSSMQQQCKENFIKYRLFAGSSSWNAQSDKFVSITNVELDGCEIMLPINIQELRIEECNDLRRVSDDISSLKNATDLRDFDIGNCEGIECVVSFSSVSSLCSTPPFHSLEKLYLWSLPKLSGAFEIVEGCGSGATTSILAPSTATFSHLKEMFIHSCGSIKMLLPHWLLPNLQNLETVRVEYCEQVVEILGAAPKTSQNRSDIALIKFNLPKLRELRLYGLPELKRICSKSGVMVCDSLQLIDVGDCSQLKRIPPFVPLVENGQQPYEYAPPSLKISSTTEWWESLEWNDHPNFKDVLQPLWVRNRMI